MDQPLGQITVYQADPFGFYADKVIAYEFALARGTYNVPYGALLAAPPADIPVGQCAFRAGADWTLVEDHRNDALYRIDTAEQYVLGQTVIIAGSAACFVGAGPVPAWLTALVPPAPGSTWVNGAWVAPETAPAA